MIVYDHPECSDQTIFDPYYGAFKSLSVREEEIYPLFTDVEVYIADQQYQKAIENLISMHGDDPL